MSYQIVTVPSARKELSKLPKTAQQQISEHIDALADNPRPHGHIKLAGPSGDYRIKVELSCYLCH
jgi:mRNA interferase RelE/StbE